MKKRDKRTAARTLSDDAALDRTALKAHFDFFSERRDEMVSTIRQMVEIESPSDNKAAVDHLGEHVASRFSAIGGRVEFHRVTDFGNHLQVNFEGASGRKPVLLLGHIDTVYPLGTLQSMPCKIDKGRLWGPGVLDMKSGIGLMIHALGALRSSGSELPRPVTVLLVSDEEIGSDTSRHITESLAKKSEAVFVLEPSYGLDGAVKTARKGVGEYLIKVTGKAAHSGLDFEKGVNAVVELARQIEKVSKFTDLKRGLTVNPGVISGGTRVNVVPAEATVAVDLRISKLKDAAGIDRKFRSLRPFDRKCRVTVTGGLNRPPLERTGGVVELYRKAASISRSLGHRLGEAAVGGGSDGNFTGGLGIPTLDGLGGVGEGAHATHESIVIETLPWRAALLAGLITAL
jgi:glutamate carboxypeptidase